MMHTIIGVSDRFRGKSAGGLYCDVVEEFDYETGRLLNTLDQLGLSKDTLVIYTSDNGPWNQPKYTERKKGHPEGETFWGEAGLLRKTSEESNGYFHSVFLVANLPSPTERDANQANHQLQE